MGVLNVKQSGLGDQLYVHGYDVSGDTGALQRISGSVSPLVVTGINKSAPERIFGRRDGGIDWQSWFNDATSQEHDALKGLPYSDVVIQYGRGSALGSPAAGVVAKRINYDPTRGEDGELSFALQSLGNGFALEWGEQLTAGIRSDTTATNGTGVDMGTGSTSFGASFYLNLFTFTGTSVTIKVQESSDNGAGDAFADVTGGSFGALSAARQGLRIATANNQTVERYLRVVTTGTFSQASFAVMAVRTNVASVLL